MELTALCTEQNATSWYVQRNYCILRSLKQTIPEGSELAVDTFRVECEMLRQLHHPNIVQYLGTHEEKGSNTVILLMEVMDCSLNAYLKEHKKSPLPFHREVDLMFDISLALDYLHANNIYHRDLSSKNILLKGEKAKVSDFGVAKLNDPNAGYSNVSPCPGNILYMPPEVLQVPPQFEKSLDEFCMGVVMIEIMNRTDPQPTELHVVKEKRGVLEIIPEVIRRKADIELCDQLNPVLQIALCCISNDPVERPLADQISRLLSLLQTTTEYRNSASEKFTFQANSNNSTSSRSSNGVFDDFVRIELDDRSGILKEMETLKRKLKEKDQKILEQQQMLNIREKQLQEKHERSKVTEENFLVVSNRVQQQAEVIQEKDRVLQECYGRMNVKDQKILDLENSVRKNETSIQMLKSRQTDVDHHVSNYITQIEVLQSHISELQLENQALNERSRGREREFREIECELRETRSQLIGRERELVNATLRGLQSLKPSSDGKKRR